MTTKAANINQFLQLFNQLSKKDQLVVADRIDKQTFDERWQLIDNTLPDVNFSDDEIMNEVRAERYGEQKN